MNRHCLDCGTVTQRTTRCAPCQKALYARKNASAGYRRTRAWRTLSAAQRAAQPFCATCGTTVDLTADHVNPRDPTLLQTLCRECNGRKGNRP